jgi:hypothetical protein
LLSVPQEKPPFGYNISSAVFASLDSIAAGAKFCCCSAFARPLRRLAHEMLRMNQQFAAGRAVGCRSQLASSAHERIE